MLVYKSTATFFNHLFNVPISVVIFSFSFFFVLDVLLEALTALIHLLLKVLELLSLGGALFGDSLCESFKNFTRKHRIWALIIDGVAFCVRWSGSLPVNNEIFAVAIFLFWLFLMGDVRVCFVFADAFFIICLIRFVWLFVLFLNLKLSGRLFAFQDLFGYLRHELDIQLLLIRVFFVLGVIMLPFMWTAYIILVVTVYGRRAAWCFLFTFSFVFLSFLCAFVVFQYFQRLNEIDSEVFIIGILKVFDDAAIILYVLFGQFSGLFDGKFQ